MWGNGNGSGRGWPVPSKRTQREKFKVAVDTPPQHPSTPSLPPHPPPDMPIQLTASRAVRRSIASPLYTISPTAHLRSRVIRSSPVPQTCRHFASHQRNDKRPNPSFFGKLKAALKDTKIEWYSIPVGLGIAVVGFTQIRKRSNSTQQSGSYGEDDERPVKPMASW